MTLTPLVTVAIAASILIGFLSVLMGSVRAELSKRFDTPEAELPDFRRWLHLVWIPLMPITGWMIDRWGVFGFLFAGSLALSFGVAWLGVARKPTGLLWGILALAWGGSAITLSGIRLMPEVFHLGNASMPESALCVGFLFVALSALLTQAFYPTLIRRLGLGTTLLLSALMCLAPAGIASFMESGVFPQGRTDAIPAGLLQSPQLWLLTLLIFFWFPLEHSLDVWPKPFLAELGYTGRAITTLLAGFWFWFLVMRLVMGYVYLQGMEIWLVFVLALIPSMVLGNLVGAYARSSGYFGFWVIGACYGPLLPAFLGTTMHRFDNRCLILGLMLMIDSLCAIIVAPAFERYLRGHTARQAMRIPLIFGLFLSAVILVLALIDY